MGQEVEVSSSTVPLRAHHRLMRNIVSTSFSDSKVAPRPEEFDLVSRVFVRAGGSWKRVFGGSVGDMGLLKRTIKAAIDGGHFTKAPKWGE